MNRRRLALGAIVLGLLAIFVNDVAAQRDKAAPVDGPTLIDSYECPKCKKVMDAPDGKMPASCPFCKVKLPYVESEEDPKKKYFLWGGGILLVIGLIGVALKYTVFKAPPPKKKKKRRDDDDEDDRPRKKRRPVMEDDDEERPRKKKPRIVDEDE